MLKKVRIFFTVTEKSRLTDHITQHKCEYSCFEQIKINPYLIFSWFIKPKHLIGKV